MREEPHAVPFHPHPSPTFTPRSSFGPKGSLRDSNEGGKGWRMGSDSKGKIIASGKVG